jgi:hypothetical protein
MPTYLWLRVALTKNKLVFLWDNKEKLISIEIKHLLFMSKGTDQDKEIKLNLSKIPACRVTTGGSEKSPDELKAHGPYDCVIFNMEAVGIVQVAVIRSTCEVVKVPQAIIFADSVDDGAIDLLSDDKAVTLIEKSLIDVKNDISGLCIRLIDHKPPVYHRESFRYPTNQTATVALETGKQYKGKCTDMSDRGACLELNTNVLKIKDKIKVTIFLEKLNRQRVVDAEVRWAKSFPGHSILGIRFLQ